MLAVGRRVAALGLVLLVLSFGACNSTPTLPLPPPVAQVSFPDEQGFALVEGEAQPDAYIFVLNETRDDGVISKADQDGLYSVRIQAQSDDDLVIWQALDGESGELKRVTVPRPR
jgi:hypothetical protein